MQNMNYAGLTLTSDGIRVNWSNVAFFEYELDDTPDIPQYIIKFKWKYKASIRTETVRINKAHDFDIQKYFQRWGLKPFTPNSFINTRRILLVEEIEIHRGPQDFTSLRIVFLEGFEHIIKMKSDSWNWWRSNNA